MATFKQTPRMFMHSLSNREYTNEGKVRISIQHKGVGIRLNQGLVEGTFVFDFRGQKHSFQKFYI
jgi:hypothetical protein